MPHRHPAAPCLGPDDSGDEKTSFLHLEELNREDKRTWVEAAAKAKLTLPEWVQRELNLAAAREAAANLPPKP